MIYLDHAATTPIDEVIIKNLPELLKKYFANPSSSHAVGLAVNNQLESARNKIAELFNLPPNSIYFINSATTAANIILQGYCSYLKHINDEKNEIIISEIEHPAIQNTAVYLKSIGFNLRIVKVNSNGQIDKRHLQELLSDKIALVAIMVVNNEIGTIQDIPDIAKMIKEYNEKIFFLSDFVQGIGKINHKDMQSVDAWFISGHKIGSPKGIACFYLNENFRINPILFGGGQEKGIFPGTTDAVMPTLLAQSIENKILSLEQHTKIYNTLRDHFLEKLKSLQIKYNLTIDANFSTPAIISIDFNGVKSSHIVSALEKRDIYVSARAACSSFSTEESNVIKTIQLRRNQKLSPIRISFSHLSTIEEIDSLATALKEILSERN